MNKKQQFVEFVKTLVHEDSFGVQVADKVDENTLPNKLGAAALEFVVAIQGLQKQTLQVRTKRSFRRPRQQPQNACRRPFKAAWPKPEAFDGGMITGTPSG